MSITSHHIPFACLVDLAEGRMAPAEQAQACAHVASCPGCAAEVTWLARVIELMRADDAKDAPSHVLASAKCLFESSARAPQPGLP